MHRGEGAERGSNLCSKALQLGGVSAFVDGTGRETGILPVVTQERASIT